MKEVPGVVWVCITVVFLAVIGAFVVLSVTGSSSDDLSKFINTLMNLGMLILGSGGLAFGASAAVNAKKASQQTNGGPGGLKDTVKDAVQEAISNGVPDDATGK